MGHLLCRSPLSIDLATQPPPAPASEETVIPASDPSCNKRARREETGSDLGRIGEDRRSPRLEPAVSKTGAEEAARPEAPTDAVSSLDAATEADPTPAGEIAPAGAATLPPPTAKDVAAGNDAATHASSDPRSQEDTREATAEATEETPMRAGSLEPPKPAARTSPSPTLTPSVQAVVPATGKAASATAGSLFFRLASDSGEASQGLLTTRVARSGRDENSPAPEVATQGASRGKAPATTAGSGVGSLSSTSQLQQEWADTASSADAGGKLRVQGSKPTLAELDRQFSVVKESLQNIGFQFLDAIRMTNVSITPLASDFFCWLRDKAHSSMAHFAIRPSPRVSR
jgi:hypothetical protein